MEQFPIPELINSRYRVKETIGRGGMATVHLAADTRLGRDVALKVLKPELARDDSFQERFQREAQAVAGLNHHTITSVYDTGEIAPPSPSEVTRPFIVMEFVPGKTLRQLVREGALSTADAVQAMDGILDALAYSHRSGIVHRDIKPANVIITPEKRVKVMDFGIARAIEDTQAALTQTQAVLGTAQYLSPEQARGENVDARSDLYSAACVFFEMLTGRAPFVGEASVDIAAQHVRDAPPAPSELQPELHPAFDDFMAQALAKPRAQRFQSAQEMQLALRDLPASDADDAAATRPMPGAAGLGVLGAGAGAAGVAGAAASDDDQTRVTSRVPSSSAASPAAAAAGAGAAGAGAGAGAGAAAAAGPASAQQAPVFTITPDDGPRSGVPAGSGAGIPLDPDAPTDRGGSSAEPGRRRSPLLWLLPLLLLVALVAAAGYVWANRGPDTVVIPEVVGMESDEAQSELEDRGLEVDLEQEFSPDVPKDHVVSSDPSQGSEVDEGSTVTLAVSDGSESVTVPDGMEGQSESYAREMLVAAGLTLAEQTDTRNSPTVPEGLVVATDPDGGQEVARDSEVSVILSTGQVTVPDVTGRSRDDAEAALGADDVQLPVAVTTTETASAPAGSVVSQSVPGGQDVAQGTAITITVAEEPAEAPAAPAPSDPSSDTAEEAPSSSAPSSSDPSPSAEPSEEPSPEASAEPTRAPTTEPTTEPTTPSTPDPAPAPAPAPTSAPADEPSAAATARSGGGSQATSSAAEAAAPASPTQQTARASEAQAQAPAAEAQARVAEPEARVAEPQAPEAPEAPASASMLSEAATQPAADSTATVDPT